MMKPEIERLAVLETKLDSVCDDIVLDEDLPIGFDPDELDADEGDGGE